MAIPVKTWIPWEDIEAGAQKQLMHLTLLPFAMDHIAVMPDIHQGYGMPIGTIMKTRDVVVPNAVGVDIGCGMICVKTNVPLTQVTTGALREVLGGTPDNHGGIRTRIPTGFNHHKDKVDESLLPYFEGGPICFKEKEKALRQLGTLGGGNHFIELQAGSDGFLYFMVHSGSRNLGFTVANHYANMAKMMNDPDVTGIPHEWQLDPLSLYDSEGILYMEEMSYCMIFAQSSRAHMAGVCMEEIQKVFLGASTLMSVDTPHNYAVPVGVWEGDGHPPIIHRKGAIFAGKGAIAAIPGSQGTCSYLVEGLGNEDSFLSASHGAGRKMSRARARRELILANEQLVMAEIGALHTLRGKSDLDEAPGAYKDISVVMSRQEDLVTPTVTLKPLASIKA